MAAGLKPASRIAVDAGGADDAERRLRDAGMAVVRRGPVPFGGRLPVVLLYVAPAAGGAREVAEVEARLLAERSPAITLEQAVALHRRLGLLLGFPACCVDEFCERVRRGVGRRLDGREAHEDFVAAEGAARASKRFLGRLNDLAADRRVRLVTFSPCRYDCPVAAGYAAGVFEAAGRSDPGGASALRSALLGRFSIGPDGARGTGGPGDVVSLDFTEF